MNIKILTIYFGFCEAYRLSPSFDGLKVYKK